MTESSANPYGLDSEDILAAIAVQGAAPSRISPAMYCCASAGAIRSTKTTSKKRTPRPAMVKGLKIEPGLQR